MLDEKIAFTQEDFKVGDEWVNPAVAHEHANRLLEERLQGFRKIFGLDIPGVGWHWSEENVAEDTHSARAVCLERLNPTKIATSRRRA